MKFRNFTDWKIYKINYVNYWDKIFYHLMRQEWNLNWAHIFFAIKRNVASKHTHTLIWKAASAWAHVCNNKARRTKNQFHISFSSIPSQSCSHKSYDEGGDNTFYGNIKINKNIIMEMWKARESVQWKRKNCN